MDNKLGRPIEGGWWRFKAYEVRDGWIRPRVDSHLEAYDPWEAHDSAWETGVAADPKAKRVALPPFQSLIRLADSLGVGTSVDPSPEDCERIERWCAQYGLLGLLPHCLTAVTFPPTWEKEPITGKVLPTSRSWIRVPNGWNDVEKPHLVLNGQMISATEQEIGERVDRAHLPPSFALAGAHIWKGFSFEMEFRPVPETLRTYFPDVDSVAAETYRYPVPLSEKFWVEYAERVENFIAAAFFLRNAVRDLSVDLSPGVATRDQASRALSAQGRLNALASGTRQFFAIAEDGGLIQRWVSTSLLSSLAMMATQSLVRGQTRLCEACGDAFSSTAYQAKYCSSRCRERSMKRRQRRKQKKSERDSKESDGGST